VFEFARNCSTIDADLGSSADSSGDKESPMAIPITRSSVIVLATVALAACATTAPPPRYEASAPPRHAPAAQPTRSLHDAVHAALEREMGNAASGITVRVEGSDVHLGGRVRSQAEHDRAHDIAHRVRGVNRVFHNNLRVG
jgi:hypothetical protein